ncbi:hypothetical protein [Paraliomyxa miuraensis]|uniref:hypothetical protein n=1 Tax=Paraliomyxa miuraensis TaxID=376150 RepID=UPI00224E1052|nr:hypothetical protein [Paraliomyxa miuraensis]MCX4247699.1 hypothetical protein [Paraliomyxa miuraensis]
MKRSLAVATTWVVAALTAQPGCGEGSGQDDAALQRLETRLCEKWQECGCTTVPLECGGWPVDDPFVEPGGGALVLDPACVEPWWSWVDALSCETPDPRRYADLCPLYHGTRRVGDDCSDFPPHITQCAAGLMCIAGQCRDPQLTAAGGEDEPCDIDDWCEDDLACVDAQCQRLPGPGELCLEGRCQDGAKCVDDRCATLPGPGQPCLNDACQSGSRCETNANTGERICMSLASVGEPCMGHGECVSGNCPAGSCQPPAQSGDRCSQNLPCGPGLRCQQGICRAPGEGSVPTSACSILDDL